MLYFLYGPNDFSSLVKLNQIKTVFREKNKSSLNLFELQASDFNLENFKNALKTDSLFFGKRLVIVKDMLIAGNTEHKNNLLLFLKSKNAQLNIVKSERVIVVFRESDQPDKRQSLFKFLFGAAKVQEFKPFTSLELRQWILNRFKAEGINISNILIDKLIALSSNDLWMLNNEIKKLIAFNKDTQEVSDQSIDLLVKVAIQSSIFNLIEALAENNKKNALNLLYKHLEMGDNELYILSMFVYQFRVMLQIKSLLEKNTAYCDLIKQSGLHPFVVRKNMKQLKKISFNKIEKAYKNLLEMEVKIKNSSFESMSGLVSFIFKLSSSCSNSYKNIAKHDQRFFM